MDHAGADLHDRGRRHYVERFDLGDVPPQPQHDAGDDDARHEKHALTAKRLDTSLTARRVFAALAVLAFAGFAALGTWQVERRTWKLDLIARVEQRVHAPAVAAPGPAQWPQVTEAADEYRRVRLTGTFLHDRETLVQAVTELGSGFWVMTPLRLADDTVVLVNRGFVPPEAAKRSTRSAFEPTGATTVTGLLRMSQLGGAFLRHNDPAGNRWFSRDVQAIAAARGLGDVAPYFVDADAAATNPAGGARAWPAGGLTVITFHNSHLVYAITWYAMALMVAAATWQAGRKERVLRRTAEPNTLRAKGEREDDTPH